MPITIAIVAIVLVGVIAYGFHTLAGGRRGANGEDLSKPAVPPANMGQMMQKQMHH